MFTMFGNVVKIGENQVCATYGLCGCTAVAFFNPETKKARCVHIPPVYSITQPGPGEIMIYYTPENSRYTENKYVHTYSLNNNDQSGIWEVRIADGELEFTDRHGAWHRIGDIKCSHPYCESTAKGYCAKCRKVQYCSKSCQKSAWKYHGHKKSCYPVGLAMSV